MERKNILIIVFVLVILIVALGASYMMFFNKGDTTNFNAAFISGSFTGNVSGNVINDSVPNHQFQASYIDSNNGITYNMSTLKDGDFLIDLMQLQGLQSPEHRQLGDNSWNIFYSQAVPNTQVSNNTTTDNSSVYNVYICQADKDNQTFLIYVISNSSKVECDGSLYCPMYKDYVEPLLTSTTLKTNPSAPTGPDVLGIDNATYNQLLDQIKNAKGAN